MTESCVILGGTGYIGWRWAQRLWATGKFGQIIVADLQPAKEHLPSGVSYLPCDVRQPLAHQLGRVRPDWLFNFAAIHREPGHERGEYFETNLAGARRTTEFADEIGCKNILFTSSIAVYGPTSGPTSERCATCPTTAYGISKLTAEWMQIAWQKSVAGRRLVICRPGVVYGPGDPGNILRMIRAVKRGYFVFPGSRVLRKSYAYIEGLLDSFEFMMQRGNPLSVYNYVERETLPLEELVRVVQRIVGRSSRTLAIPLPLLTALASVMQVLSGGRSSIHPARVHKVATSTHIIPEVLAGAGFQFRYDFESSLRHWRECSATDFV